MNEHALGVLEFGKIVRMLVDRTSFPPGAERAARISPTVDLVSIEEDLDRTCEFVRVLQSGGALPLGGASDARDALSRSALSGAALSCEDLVRVARAVSTVGEVRSYLSSRAESLPAIWKLGERLVPNESLRDAISAAIDDASFEVRDGASRELAKIRRAIDRTRGRLDEKLQSILQRELSSDTIQEPAVHIRNGRHVLPVKRGSRSRIKGIVHDQSASGATVFVEPMATVPLNNELSELAAGEKKEIERILRSLTELVSSGREALAESIGILGRLDYHWAAALLTRDLGAARPVLNTEGRLSIRGGRHPVLYEMSRGTGDPVVPLDLELGNGVTCLVVSGPNAGGKTVTLKTVGLLTLMAQCGLPVPAGADSVLAVVRDIFADIGDEQSIEQSLSTFSSHLRAMREILLEADSDTLVLLDELGAGTDPDEGASLAIAILEDLAERGAPTIATTHLGSVKSHVHNHEGMVNGSMAFDPETLEPAFRFVPGVPGASRALAIAESQGLPAGVLERARSLRDQGAARIDDLLADLAERGRELTETLETAAIERDRASAALREYEARLAGVREERRAIRTRALAEARDVLDGAKSLVEETVKEIRAEEAAAAAIRHARAELSRRRTEVAEELRSEEPRPAEDENRPAELAVGMDVRVAGLGRTGKLLTLPDGKGKVRVRMKNAELEVDADELREAGPREEKEPSRPAVSFSIDGDEEPATELHLRGMTTDEVGDSIETFLSRAVMQGMKSVRIVHGKGTGALRARTQEVLRGMPGVKSFRLGRWGEGDTGVTVVELE